MSNAQTACPVALAVTGQRISGLSASAQPRGTKLPIKSKQRSSAGRFSVKGLISTAVGAVVSWSVDANGHVFPANGGAAEEHYPHIVIDRHGVEWTVREVPTSQVWAKGKRCLVLNSRECVRRVWQYPRHWRTLDADTLLRLGVVD